MTYGELAALTRRFAAELERRSIAKGDRVLLWGENSAEWVAAFFGCVMRGVIPVPVDYAGSVEFVRRVVHEVRPKLIVGDAAKIQLLDGVQVAFEHFEAELPTQAARVIENLGPDDTLQIIFTSGTTGEPKGVVHTHRNVLASLGPIEQEMGKYLKYERPFHPIRILHTLPLSHVFGQFMGLWTPPLMASELHYESRLVASELAEHIRRNRVSVVAAVPRVLDLMQAFALTRFPNLAERVAQAEGLKAWQRWWQFRDVHKFFGLKFWAFVVGGAALSASGEQFWGRMGFVVIQGYGMTETTAVISLNHPFRAAQGTIGQVLPGREVRLSDEGEVLVRGETISNTTWQHGQMQKQESEWLATGDLAAFDAAGNLQFRGRKKDVIVTSSGLNVFPEDLEAALGRQAGVKVATVVETDAGSGPEARAVLVMQTANRGRCCGGGGGESRIGGVSADSLLERLAGAGFAAELDRENSKARSGAAFGYRTDAGYGRSEFGQLGPGATAGAIGTAIWDCSRRYGAAKCEHAGRRAAVGGAGVGRP